MAIPPGTQLGPYEVVAALGAGGMGEVYLAHDARLDRHVAIKVLPPHLTMDPTARQRLRREALAAAALDHPFICKVFEIGEHDTASFIAMEYVVGQTLHERMSSGPLSAGEALRIAGQIADAIEAAHAQRFVHRDLKPANVMLTSQGHVKVMDFGLARRVVVTPPAASPTISGTAGPLTEAGTRVGTPDYMSPEQAVGDDVDERSDLFAFGIVLAEMLTGTHPFRRGTHAGTLSAIVGEPPVFDPTGIMVSSPALKIVRRLLAKARADRYQSMSDVRRDLSMLLGAGSGVGGALAAPGRGNLRFPLVGRDAERAELLQRLDAAVAGNGSVVMIAGEAGIGKTRLTAEILAEARNRGVFCLVGHCSEMEGAPPYMPFIEMLEYSARNVPAASFRHALGEAASGVSKLMPELRRLFEDVPEPPDLPPEQQRRYLFNAYLDFFERACVPAPIAVVVEDLHWADEPSLMLLQHLTSRVPSLRLFVMGTYRDVELDATRPFARTLETLLRERRAKRIPLRRLPVDAVERMLTSMSGQVAPPSLARVIFDETEGNPFFVEEVFQHLAEEGRLFDATGTWRQDLRARDLDVPESVRLVIGRRLLRLGPAARALLTTASVIGRTFSLRLLEAVASEPEVVVDAIEEAERAELLVAEPVGREARYRFAHELFRQTLADGLSLPRRQRLHARLADAIERLFDTTVDKHASALAHHLYQAGAAADPGKATKYLLVAARHARAAAGFEDALEHLDNALSLVEGEHNEFVAQLVVERASVLLSLGRPDAAIAEFRRAVDLYDALDKIAELGTASLLLASALAWHARHVEVGAVMSRALRRVADRDPRLRCRLLCQTAAAQVGSGQESQRGLDTLAEAYALQRTIGDPRLEGTCMTIDAHVHYHTGQFDRAAANAVRAAAAARACGDLGTAVGLEWLPAAATLWNGRIAAARAAAESVIPDAERAGHVVVVWVCRSFETVSRFFAGDFTGALSSALATRDFAAAIGTRWIWLDDYLLGIITHTMGRRDEARAYLRAAIAGDRPTFWSGPPRASLFYMMAIDGDREGLRLLEQVPPTIPVPGQAAPLGAWISLSHLVRGYFLLGEMGRAAALRQALELRSASVVILQNDLAQTAAGIAAAAAGDWQAAEEHHRAAVHQGDALRLEPLRPDAREWYGRMLLARGAPGDADRARSFITEAVLQYDALGMTDFARRASRLLEPSP